MAEVVVVAGEATLITYYTVQTYNARSEFLQLAQQGYINQGCDFDTAAQRSRQELQNIDDHSPGFWSLYGHYFYQEYIGWWW